MSRFHKTRDAIDRLIVQFQGKVLNSSFIDISFIKEKLF